MLGKGKIFVTAPIPGGLSEALVEKDSLGLMRPQLPRCTDFLVTYVRRAMPDLER